MGATGRVTTSPDNPPPKRLDFEHGYLTGHYHPILGNSALDRLANASYQIVIEGASYRERLSPHRALLGTKGGD